MFYCQGLALTFTTLWANAADNKLIIVSLFSRKIGFDFSCKLSPKETICMKCQTHFLGKIRKNIKFMSYLEYVCVFFLLTLCGQFQQTTNR